MGKRLTNRRAALATVVALIAAALAGGCGSQSDLPMRQIALFAPTNGALKDRAQDMRLAAELALKKINHDTKRSRLELIDGMRANVAPIAAVDALAGTTISRTGELMVSLAPQRLTLTDATRSTRETEAPRIHLLPSVQATRDARDQYVLAGGSTSARADNPLIAGTPRGQFVTPALPADDYPPAGEDFFESFEEEYGRPPDRYAIYGYEAVGLIVDALDRVEQSGQAVNQAAVAASALGIKDRFSPVGHYDVLPSGQTTLYVFAARGRGAPNGQAALLEAVRQP